MSQAGALSARTRDEGSRSQPGKQKPTQREAPRGGTDVKDSQAAATRWKGALWASEPAGRRLPKVGLLAALSTGAIMTQPHLALGLPGHRALTWLALLFIMRMVGGPGWATAVGLASAVGTLAIGRSPAGTFWGVLQYVV